jgi:lipooligosaccharide transport system permease protein
MIDPAEAIEARGGGTTPGIRRPVALSAPSQVRAMVYYLRAYRRTWRASIMSTFINPTLYLLAMGVGLGSFVDKGVNTASLGSITYLQFVAPALAATAAATTATNESLYPIMGAFKWQKTYYAMLSTPLGVGDVLASQLLWIATRIAMAVAAYLVVMAAFGTTLSPWAIAVLPVGILTGMAFSAPLVAYAITQDSENSFALVFRLGLVPLFLFSGVFFPISQLPAAVRWIAYVTPLWHGVALCRDLSLGQVKAGPAAAHLAFLAVFVVVGTLAATRTFRRRLLT